MSDFPQPIEYDVLPNAVLDYCTLTVIGRVAHESLVDARVRKVVGLDGGDVIISFDRFDKNDTGFSKWLFSADARQFRIHPWPDPLPGKTPQTHLVEVASHHLSGARVESVEVVRFERIIIFDMSRREYTGEEVRYRFIAELMGKHSNLILVDATGTILATCKPVHSYQSRVREIRAGKEYQSPPKQDRIEPREFSKSEWDDFLNSADSGDPLDDHIFHTFHGMSLAWARSVCDRAGIFPEKSVHELTSDEREKLRISFVESIDMVTDGIPLTGESRVDFVKRVTSEFYERAVDIALDKARSKIMKVVDRRRRKLRTLKNGLDKDLEKAERADQYKKKADLLLANLYQVMQGADQIIVDDWETGEKVQLSIDSYTTPQMQAERWYQRYRKLKRTLNIARERKLGVQAEEEELLKLEEDLTAASSIDEINEIREQCVLRGIIPYQKEKGSQRGKFRDKGGWRSPQTISAHRYRSNDGFLITAGANNLSNDALRRAAGPEDIWLHVRDIPGTHVYITTRGQNVPDTTLKEAAMVAVWHSKAREGSKVPVDHTRAKYVTPIPGAGPGKVRFRRERTIRVTPDESRIEMMRLMAGDDGRRAKIT